MFLSCAMLSRLTRPLRYPSTRLEARIWKSTVSPTRSGWASTQSRTLAAAEAEIISLTSLASSNSVSAPLSTMTFHSEFWMSGL